MTRRVWLLTAIAVAALRGQSDCTPHAPCYSEAAVVNAASFVRAAIAPNTLVAIFGSNLSYSTRALTSEDVRGGRLPVQLGGVTVHVGPEQAPVYYVSPGQINVLIPGDLRYGSYDVRVVRDGWAGPAAQITLFDAAPALFLVDEQTVVATWTNFSLISKDSPARPGQEIILWATGLGRTIPSPATYDEIPLQAAWIERLSELRVLLDGVAVESSRILYAGVTPTTGGLYQINLRLPEILANNPEVRIAIGDTISPTGVRLPVRAEN